MSSSLSLSGKNDSRNGSERRPVRSARSSGSKSRSRDGSTLKGLVEGVGAAGSSNAARRASFVAGAFFAVLFSIGMYRRLRGGAGDGGARNAPALGLNKANVSLV